MSSNPLPARVDTLRAVETPEGVDLALRAAGPHVRLVAYSLDFLLRMVALSVSGAVVGQLGGAGASFQLILGFALEWLYPVAFEVYGGGATPGKRAFGLVVLADDGRPVTLRRSLLRNLMRAVDFAPLFNVAALGSMLASRDFKRLGDHVAGTIVVHAGEARVVRQLAPAQAETPPEALELEEQAALVEFSQRVGSWQPARAREIADALEPLTGERGQRGVARTLAFASWAGGER